MSTAETSVGIVGAGYWGRNLIRNFRALPDCRVAWVCDQKPGRRQYVKELFPDLPVTDDVGVLLSDPSLDAMVIGSWLKSMFKSRKRR